METGTIYKYNKNRKYSVILPDQWKTCRMDVLFESNSFDTTLGEKVQYTWVERNGKRYAQNLQKLDT
jgi:cold shock CspA family protein